MDELELNVARWANITHECKIDVQYVSPRIIKWNGYIHICIGDDDYELELDNVSGWQLFSNLGTISAFVLVPDALFIRMYEDSNGYDRFIYREFYELFGMRQEDGIRIAVIEFDNRGYISSIIIDGVRYGAWTDEPV